MNSLEFTTKIEHGIIHLPSDCDGYDNSTAHVVVTIQSEENRIEKKNRLFEAFRKMQEADVFRGIDDPSEWQRKLRDEWE